MTLDQVESGDTVIIKRIGGETSALRQRLLDMGITKDTPALVERVAPLGDPVEVLIKGCHLAIRKNEAAHIEVEPPPDV